MFSSTPVGRSSSEVRSSTPPPAYPPRIYKVLIHEDSPTISKVLAKKFELEGKKNNVTIQTTIVDSFESGVEALKKTRFDALMTDNETKDASGIGIHPNAGLELAEWAHQNPRRSPLIRQMYSGDDVAEQARKNNILQKFTKKDPKVVPALIKNVVKNMLATAPPVDPSHGATLSPYSSRRPSYFSSEQDLSRTSSYASNTQTPDNESLSDRMQTLALNDTPRAPRERQRTAPERRLSISPDRR